MATTTNYGWTTPDDTGLVKDGASAIRTLGSAVDSTLKTQIDAQIPKSLVDAKGDLIVGSAADTAARLAVGTNGQYLKANSSATNGVEWGDVSAGSLTLLSTTSLTGASVTISSISQSYKKLHIVVYGVTNATANGGLLIEPNSVSNLTDYTGVAGGNFADVTNERIRLNSGLYTMLRTDANNAWVLTINDYASTTNFKPVSWYGNYLTSSSASASVNLAGNFRSNSAISSLYIWNYAGNFSTGTVKVYGVN